jgi:prevent-host-death family protein
VRTIGSRQPKAHLGAVLREVRERGEEYAVTHRGKTIARIVPEELPAKKAEFDWDAYWAKVDEIGRELAKKWPKGLTAAQAISEDRNRLE